MNHLQDQAQDTEPKLFCLIVDDDESFVQILKIRLRSWRKNLIMDIAVTLEEARALLNNTSRAYDMVILDQNLPDGRGADLFEHPRLGNSAVLAVSADPGPEVPGAAIKAGAQHFLGKGQVGEPLFLPLLDAILARRRLERELFSNHIKESRLQTIKILLSTLRHEINNPLGAVMGGTYLLRARGDLRDDQHEALRLIEESSYRIKHVIERLCAAAELEEVLKGQEQVFHIPGDIPWEEQNRIAEERAITRARERQMRR